MQFTSGQITLIFLLNNVHIPVYIYRHTNAFQTMWTISAILCTPVSSATIDSSSAFPSDGNGWEEIGVQRWRSTEGDREADKECSWSSGKPFETDLNSE